MPRISGVTEYIHPKPQEMTLSMARSARQEIAILDAIASYSLTPFEIAEKSGLSVSSVKAGLLRLRGICVKSKRDRWSLM